MAHRSKEVKEAVGQCLLEHGVVNFVFGKANNGHQVVEFDYAGRHRRFQFSFSPSRVTGELHNVKRLKRKLRRWREGRFCRRAP